MPHADDAEQHSHRHADGGHAGHGHSGHSHGASTTDERRLVWALFIIALFMIVEVVGGVVSGSLALFAIAVWITVEAVQRFWQPVDVMAGTMLAIAIAGLAPTSSPSWS